MASFGNTAELLGRIAKHRHDFRIPRASITKPSYDDPATTMSSDDAPNPMAESGITIRSDSEQYSGEEISASPPSSSSPAVILYQPPTLWSLLRGATINLFLPFVNGMMLGFGELFAHEAAFRLGWSGTRVCYQRHVSRAGDKAADIKVARSFPSLGDKHIQSVLGSKLWIRQGRTSGWTT